MPDASSSRWSDLDRPALDSAALQTALTRDSALWRSLEVVPEIGSTNAALTSAAADGTPEGAVLVAEHQVAGRGRLDQVTGVRASLKWPNDLVAADGRKLAGILAETVTSPATPMAVVVGVGLNVNTTADELPDTGTSLSRVLGAAVDRGPVLLAFLRAVERRYRHWTEVLGDPVSSGLAQDYLAWSSTIGTEVAVTLPDGSTLSGTAQAVDWDGRLVVATGSGTVQLASGDVRHVR